MFQYYDIVKTNLQKQDSVYFPYITILFLCRRFHFFFLILGNMSIEHLGGYGWYD